MEGSPLPDPEIRIYKAYGLTIALPLLCPELTPSAENPNISVRFSTLPMSLPNPIFQGPFFDVTHNTVLIKVKDRLRIMITNGNQIFIDTNGCACEDDIKVHLLGSAMAAVLHQRGMLPLHASCLKIKGTCIAFIGNRGIGKSTLASAFHEKENQILSDDICAIHVSHDGKPIVLPGYPQLKLRDDTMDKLGIQAAGLRRIRTEDNKCAVPLMYGFNPDPTPLDRIYVLESHEGRAIELIPLTGLSRIEPLLRYTYRKKMAYGMGKGRELFDLCSRVAGVVPIKRITRPKLSFRLKELVALIEDDLGKQNKG
jgi:hypothetical protein